MIPEGIEILDRLRRLADRVADFAKLQDDPDQRRYTRATESLIRLQGEKLSVAIKADDDQVIAWQLSSVAGMVKGILDISSSWSDDDAVGCKEMMDVCRDARKIEQGYR